MTSTSFSVGVEARNSSRVLRPPGGGHTDIFGVTDTEKSNQRLQKEVPSSAIKELPAAKKEEEKTEEHESPEKPKQPEENSSPKKDKSSSEQVVEKKAEEQQPAVVPPQRKRVPPGGYSSGLW